MKRRTMLHSGLSAHRPRRYSAPEATVPEDLTTVEALLDWVGDDQVKAQAVLDAEQAKPQDDQRVTLVDPLTQLLNPAVGVKVPAGDLDSRVAWVNEAEDSDDREARAQAVYQHEETANPEADLEGLKATLWPEPVTDEGSDAPAIVMPDGLTSVGKVLEWVGKDTVKAQAALDAENANEKPRVTLVKPLAELIVAEG